MSFKLLLRLSFCRQIETVRFQEWREEGENLKQRGGKKKTGQMFLLLCLPKGIVGGRRIDNQHEKGHLKAKAHKGTPSLPPLVWEKKHLSSVLQNKRPGPQKGGEVTGAFTGSQESMHVHFSLQLGELANHCFSLSPIISKPKRTKQSFF